VQGFAIDELAAVFSALQDAGWDAVLVGGQAVNLWACHYEQDNPEWRTLRPYTSRDLDYHGGLAEARLAMRVLHAQGNLNTDFDPGPNAGVLKVGLADGRELMVDILTGVYGVSSAEMERTAVTWSGTKALAGLVIRVIHPMLLLEGKVAALRGLPQADRQDAKHVRILIHVLHQWLKEQVANPRAVFRTVERLAACAASPDGVQAFVQGIDLMQALPLEAMRAADGYSSFFQQRLPQLTENVDRRRQRHSDALSEHNSQDKT
jgi:hypothetical protein